MKITYLLCITYLLLSTGCKQSRLEYALELAGENRPKLEKVLNYYKKDPENKLKYKAACFLIENMPQYYTYSSKILEKVKEEIYPLALKENCSPYQALKLLEAKYGNIDESAFERIYDLHVINSEYLIDNIEWSFKVWQESPWGKYIPLTGFVRKSYHIE